jgi:hypothetical protein
MKEETNFVISFLLAVTSSSAISPLLVKSNLSERLIQCLIVEGDYGEGVKIAVAYKTQCVPMDR